MVSLLIGVSIGLAAGITPGPLLLLVITTTLRSGRRAGVLVAAAPLAADVLVVTATLLVLGQLSVVALSVVGVVGGFVLAYLGVRTLDAARTFELALSEVNMPVPVLRALRQATAVTVLNPHPWITWVAVLGPLTLVAWRSIPMAAPAPVIGCYAALIGARVMISLLVAAGRDRLTRTGYRQTLTAAGVLLVLAAAGMWGEFGGAALSALWA